MLIGLVTWVGVGVGVTPLPPLVDVATTMDVEVGRTLDVEVAIELVG